jgi:hypothetical protein
MTTTTPASGAADLPEALRSIQRFEVVDCIDDKHVPAVIPKPHGPWVRYADHVTALAAGQATTAQAVVPAGWNLVPTEPTNKELDAVIKHHRTRIYPQDMQPHFERAIMRAVLAKWGQPAQTGEAVALDHIAAIEDGELRYMTGRKAPAYDCELYAMPDGKRAPVLFTAPQPVEREPLSDEEVDSLCKVGPVYAPDGKVTLTPPQYRDELEAAQRYGLRKGERAHGIKGGQHVD